MMYYMCEVPPNDKVRLFVIHMQGPLWKALHFAVHIVHTYEVIIEKFTVFE